MNDLARKEERGTNEGRTAVREERTKEAKKQRTGIRKRKSFTARVPSLWRTRSGNENDSEHLLGNQAGYCFHDREDIFFSSFLLLILLILRKGPLATRLNVARYVDYFPREIRNIFEIYIRGFCRNNWTVSHFVFSLVIGTRWRDRF